MDPTSIYRRIYSEDAIHSNGLPLDDEFYPRNHRGYETVPSYSWLSSSLSKTQTHPESALIFIPRKYCLANVYFSIFQYFDFLSHKDCSHRLIPESKFSWSYLGVARSILVWIQLFYSGCVGLGFLKISQD